MGKTVIPEGYRSLLSLYETQKAISLLKRLFEDRLAGALRLHRVSAPLFVSASSGLNDDLNGVERPVSFEINRVEDTAQVVHSLAKWKRLALKRYQFHPGEGLYTDMNAIRRDEELDNLHSAYVDQWDWEKIITQEDRTRDYLKQTVNAIVRALVDGLPYEVGDIVTLKKVHPCGSRDWEILRVGADFRLKCTGCGHQIMVPRKMVEKNTKNLIKKEK